MRLFKEYGLYLKNALYYLYQLELKELVNGPRYFHT